jgi:hypothetical protein
MRAAVEQVFTNIQAELLQVDLAVTAAVLPVDILG